MAGEMACFFRVPYACTVLSTVVCESVEVQKVCKYGPQQGPEAEPKELAERKIRLEKGRSRNEAFMTAVLGLRK